MWRNTDRRTESRTVQIRFLWEKKRFLLDMFDRVASRREETEGLSTLINILISCVTLEAMLLAALCSVL